MAAAPHEGRLICTPRSPEEVADLVARGKLEGSALYISEGVRLIMAHYRKPLGAAVGLNTVVGEAVAGLHANSLSLLMDGIHNLSDEMALVCVFLAFLLPTALSGTLLRAANVLNSHGLVVMSAVLVWEASARLLHPTPMAGIVPVVIGLAVAAGNGGVAWLLWKPGTQNAAIRLAYVHNLGDVGVSCAPVISGLLVTLSGRFFSTR